MSRAITKNRGASRGATGTISRSPREPGREKARDKAIRRSSRNLPPSSVLDPEALAVLQSRAKSIIDQEIGFIHNPEFSKSSVAEKFLAEPAQPPETSSRAAKVPDEIPAYFAALYATPLLTPTGEAELFRRMNFLKFLANAKRSKLNPESPDQKRIEEIETLLKQAHAARNLLVESNLRLVVSIARRLADPYYPFDDIVSDGNVALLNAIEKFDFARGFRFSTYATHVIQRDLYRFSRRRRELAKRTVSGVEDWLSATPEDHESSEQQGETFDRWQNLLILMQRELTEREQVILSLRLGIDIEKGPQTLQAIAGELGISKERVRQLEVRAIGRLQQAAAESRLAGLPIRSENN